MGLVYSIRFFPEQGRKVLETSKLCAWGTIFPAQLHHRRQGEGIGAAWHPGGRSWHRVAAVASQTLPGTRAHPRSPACVVQGQLAALRGFRGISERASVSPLLF